MVGHRVPYLGAVRTKIPRQLKNRGWRRYHFLLDVDFAVDELDAAV